MIKLFLKIFLLIGLVAAIILLSLLVPGSSNDPEYFASILDKHRRLQVLAPPRIIFIGGSGLAFGLDSKRVEQDLKMPVVNMGVHAGLGLRYNLSEIKPFIGKNDIIVIVPEYESFFGESFEGNQELSMCFFDFPEIRQYVDSPMQYLVILRNCSYALRARFFNLLTRYKYVHKEDYNRASFNEYGDAVAHLNKPTKLSGQSIASQYDDRFNTDVIPVLNNFKSFVEEKGAKVFLIYPALMDEQYKINENKITLLDQRLKRDLEIPQLSTSLDYVFPKRFFYDTYYHLTGEGREMRTQKLVVDLETALTGQNK